MTTASFRIWLLTAVVSTSGLCSDTVDHAGIRSQADQCSDVAKCEALGQKTLGSGDPTRALAYFRSQLQFAEDAEDKRGVVNAINNLTAVWLVKNDWARARSWARLALRVDPQDSLAHSNLEKIEVGLQSHPWTTDPSGIYVKYSGRGAFWDTLRFEKVRDGRVGFHMVAYRIGPGWRAWGPGSYGDIDGVAALEQGRRAIYASDPSFPSCAVSFDFKDDSVVVLQRGDCGFGYGVSANGTWDRICSGSGTDCRETPSGVPAK